MMMHHNMKFGNQMFGGLDDIVWTNIEILTLWCDLECECSHPILLIKLWLMMMYHQTMFGCRWINSSVDITDRVIFRSYKLDLENRRKKKIPARNAGSWCCITIPSLVTKCSAVQSTSSGQTFTDILNLCCDLDLECSNPFFFSTGHSSFWCCTIKPSLVANGPAV